MTCLDQGIVDRATELGITVPNVEGVKEYLRSYPGITDVVSYVFEHCRADIDKLKKKGSLFLKIYKCGGPGDEYLLLSIRPAINGEETIKEVLNIVEAIRGRYMPQAMNKSGWLQVALDVSLW